MGIVADINIPGIGPTKPVYVAGAAVVGIGAALYLSRRHKAASSASSAATPATVAPSGTIGGDPYPPDGTSGNPADPYSTDPATGETYGDELAGGGYGSAYNGATGVTDTGYGGYYPTGTNPLPVTPTPTTAPTTPQQWADQVQQVLTGVGYDPETVASAVGAYLAGAQLTADQAAIVRAALAEVPYPGTAPPVKVGTTTTTTGTATVPNVVGMRGQAAKIKLAAVGLHSLATPPTTPRGKTTQVTAQNPAAGAKVAAGSTVAIQLKVL